MIAAAVVSALAVLGFSAALVAALARAGGAGRSIAAGTAAAARGMGLSLVQPRLAAIAVYLHMAAFGATVVSGFGR